MILFDPIGNPKIETEAGAYLTLTNAVVNYDIDVHDYELLRSVINGSADIISRGEYFKGSIDWHGGTAANHTTLKALQGVAKRLWPFGTGQIAGSDPERYYPYVDVIVTRVYPYHKNSQYYLDAIIIEFESVMPYTLAQATDTGIPSGD